MSHRPSSIYSQGHHASSSSSQTALQTRINQKRLELENLRQLRDLSAQLASQMSTLEEKLATLRDGTEAVSEVLKNWSNVMGVLAMVGGQLPKVLESRAGEEEGALPGTLVRIPVQPQQDQQQQQQQENGSEVKQKGAG